MNEGQFAIEDWYIVFTPSRLKHWIFNWIDPYFQHCYMVKEDYGIWVIIDGKNCHTEVRTELFDDYPHIRELCPNSVILPVRVKIRPDRHQWHLGINSCVDVCKGIMGINNWRIWTPYQLYRYLV